MSAVPCGSMGAMVLMGMRGVGMQQEMSKLGDVRGRYGLILGALLVLLGLVVLVTAEMARRDGVRDVDAMGGAIVALQTGTAADIVEGRLVRVSGVPAMDTPAKDEQFGITADTPLLVRKVEMQQWRELKSPGGDVTYVRNWFDHPINSERFLQPERHENPRFPFAGKSFEGKGIRLGGLLLSHELLRAFPGSEQVAPDFSTMPSNLTASFRLADNVLWSSVNPQSPQLGDLRVSWSKLPLREMTVLARVVDGGLQAAPHLPTPGYVVMIGDVPLDTLMPGLPALPHNTWIWRVLALLLAAVGAWLGLSGRAGRAVDPLLALSLGVAPLALIASVIWLGASWGSVSMWLLIGALAAACAAWRWPRGSHLSGDV